MKIKSSKKRQSRGQILRKAKEEGLSAGWPGKGSRKKWGFSCISVKGGTWTGQQGGGRTF